MKNKLLCLAAFMALFGIAIAAGQKNIEGMSAGEIIDSSFDAQGNLTAFGGSLVEKANGSMEKIGSFAKGLLGNEKITAKISLLNGGTEAIGIATQNGTIVQAKRGAIEGQTMEVSLSKATINQIIAARDQKKELLAALKDGRIQCKATDLATSLKIGAVTVFSSFGSLLGSIVTTARLLLFGG